MTNKDKIYQIISESLKLLSKKDLYKLIPESNPSDIDADVKQLRREGKVFYTKKKKIALPEDLNIIVGRFQGNEKGYGFVLGKDSDIFIPRRSKNGALNNDQVAAVLLSRRKFGLSPEGEVIQVIERANHKVVGTVIKHQGKVVVQPSDRRIDALIEVDDSSDYKIKPGNVVNIQINSWPDRRGMMRGTVVEILGEKLTFPVEVEVLLREHELEDDFPAEANDELSGLDIKLDSKEVARRKDYRDIFTVTIDGLDAKDFDDAVSITKNGSNLHLIVHIADVSHYVGFKSHLDLEALRRGTSVYLPDRVLPMLPPELSNEICSLKPNQERLTFSVEMEISPEGKILSHQFAESIIVSDFRLTYEEIDESIKCKSFKNNDVKNLVGNMLELTRILENKRLKRGSINFETLEPKVILDNKGRPVEIKIREKTPATSLIEEAMILTNETVAYFFKNMENPMIYRIHERPDEKTIEEIGLLLKRIGYQISSNIIMQSSSLQKIIEFVHERPEKYLINSLLLRAMKQARYSTSTLGHYGLASSFYTHFTSPIRRYPDLMVHRILKMAINKKWDRELSNQNFLDDICEQTSVREREADAAEREAVDLYICELMKESIGEKFEGIISGVTRFGLFVQLPNTAEGLVHVSDMKGRYNFEPERYLLREERTGQTYRLGDSVSVLLTSVNVNQKRLDFMLNNDDR